MNAAGLFHTPAPDVAADPAPFRKKRRRLLLICGVLAFAAGTVLTLTLPRHSTATGSAMSAEQAREEARRSLAAFLAAPTVEQRAEWVLGGSRLLPLMQAYYAGRETEPLAAGDFQPASWRFNSVSPDMLALELPRGRSLSTVVACMKNAGSGHWMIDWDIWAQSLDGRFRDFVTRPAEGEHTLRVRLTSASASPDEVKLEVADPFTVGSTLTLETTRPDLTALYCADLPAGATRTATVQLVWLNDPLTGTLQPALRRHVCWGFQDLDGVEAAEREPARARKHHPPMPETIPGDPPLLPLVQAAVKTTLSGPSGGTSKTAEDKAPPVHRASPRAITRK